jgi:hypothetical protein
MVMRHGGREGDSFSLTLSLRSGHDPMAASNSAGAGRRKPASSVAIHAGLLRKAVFAALATGDARRGEACRPLVIVCPEGRCRPLDDLLPQRVDLLPQQASLLPQRVAAADGAVRYDARELAAALEAEDEERRIREMIVSRRLVVVDRLETIGGTRRQLAFARLLDAAAATGTCVCVSLARTPAAAGLEAALESRLSAGLVVTWGVGNQLDDQAVDAPPRSVARVIRATARHHGIAAALLVGHGRQRSVVHVRSLAMYLSRRLTGRSLDAIGKAFGGRDHTTVMRGVRSVAERITTDAAFAGDVAGLVDELSGSGPRRRTRRRPTG